ncbi:MAG: hypothetical protein A2W00_11045 [Candidatus Eisenbacteria bacterium RBG_16_71_46]|nr:MAG: hypothetical protein A2W00_11045 [Candidatus Eisenbacteria bacterium RBG_16_71_46]
MCFYSEYVYPLLGRREIEFAGGAEALVARLARGLVARDYEVSIVTCDYGQAARELIDGVVVWRAFRPHVGPPVLRFFHPRLSRAALGLMRADAEVYYVCGAGMPAGLTCDVARLRRAGFVSAAASDYDIVPGLPARGGPLDRWWYRRALRAADAVLAQTEFQRHWFREAFGLESEVLPNVVDLPEQVLDAGQDGLVLWLGTYKAIKRPEWFVELARALPACRFVMAGVVPPPPLTQEVWEAARAAARECPNLEVRGFQTDAELQALRRRTSLVVHTSPVEGFSNVMLEAWAAGLPTVSAVDPDGLVEREGVGEVATDPAALVASVRRLMADPALRRAAGARARRHAEARHAPGVVLDVLCRVLDRVIDSVRRRRGGAG